MLQFYRMTRGQQADDFRGRAGRAGPDRQLVPRRLIRGELQAQLITLAIDLGEPVGVNAPELRAPRPVEQSPLQRDADALRIDAEPAGSFPSKAVCRRFEQPGQPRGSRESNFEGLRHDAPPADLSQG
jgi:hypothetical protein